MMTDGREANMQPCDCSLATKVASPYDIFYEDFSESITLRTITAREKRLHTGDDNGSVSHNKRP